MKANIKRKLTVAEQEALNREIERQLEIHAERGAGYFDAMVLWTLHRMYGFGKKRLREFWVKYSEAERELQEYYRTNSLNLDGVRETEFYVVENLKRIGVDIEKWRETKRPD